MISGKFCERLVQAHDVTCQLETFRAEGGSQETEGRIPLCIGHLFKANPLAGVEVLIHPLAPFAVVDREQRPGELHVPEAPDEFLGGISDGLGGDAAWTNLEQAGSRTPV
jgi:hypothetical protein